jgi:hypothetical protein
MVGGEKVDRCSSVSVFDRDVAVLKRFGNRYKLTLLRSVRRKGFEIEEKQCRGVNDSKLENNLSRAKGKVFEYAMCNDWDYFVTLTINKQFYDRYDLKGYYKDFGRFVTNYNRNHKTKIDYVLIPEMHEDGAWHLHGLIKGILESHLSAIDDLPRIPIKLKGQGYMYWEQYHKKFGFISLGRIKDRNKVSGYITKYINKDMDSSIKELNAKTYYNSKGLNVSEEIKRGTLSANSIPFDFENDYVKIKWFDSEASAKASVID